MPSFGEQQRGRPSASSDKRFAGDRELTHRIKFSNLVPDVPFDPKFIKYHFEANRFIDYHPTSLERNFKCELLCEHDLSVGKNLDFLINPDAYHQISSARIHPTDAELLEDEQTKAPADIKRAEQHNRHVSWLRKTEYISTENTKTMSTEKSETKVGYNIKKRMCAIDDYKDRESQIKAIEKTFEDAQKPVETHHSKPGVFAKQVLPLLPDKELWSYPCAQVIFDSDPAIRGRSVAKQQLDMSNAMIRGMSDEAGEQFVAYFLPSDETLEKRAQYAEMAEADPAGQAPVPKDEIFDYELVREYNWTVKNKASRGYEENYVFIIRPDCVAYNELETRVRLSKRKRAAAIGRSILDVTIRPFTEHELTAQELRMSALDIVTEEEDDEVEGAPVMDNEAVGDSGLDATATSEITRSPTAVSEEHDDDENPSPAKRTRRSISDSSLTHSLDATDELSDSE